MPFKNKKQTQTLKRRKQNKNGLISGLEAANRDFPIKQKHLEYVKSKIAGIGLKTNKVIKKGTKIIKYDGIYIKTLKEVDKKERYYMCVKHIKETYFFRLKYNAGYIDATIKGNAARFINHSCQPNCIAEQTPDKREIVIIANEDITISKELTLDYGLNTGEKCKCGHRNCKGKM